MTKEELIMLQVQSLSEIEKQAFVEALIEHLSKDKQLHLIDNCYELEDSELVDELRNEILELEQEIREIQFDKDVLGDLLEKEREKQKAAQ